MMNWMHVALNYILDLPLKVIYKMRSRVNSKKTSSTRSDSELTNYLKLVNRGIENKQKFRSYFGYRQILEHVTYYQGLMYLNRIRELGVVSSKEIYSLPHLDVIGKPRVFDYQELGHKSPTTLRYFSVASELREIFGTNLGENIAEIGAGFGGQAIVLDQLFNIETITIFDLPEVNTLISTFVGQFECKSQFYFKSEPKQLDLKIDFVISNYAFSELPRDLQLSYIAKLLTKSPKGYMIMNSGKSNVTGRSKGKVTFEDLKATIPGLQLGPEIPKTGPDNYVVYWGQPKGRPSLTQG